MSDKDVVITAQTRAPDGTSISARPCYLLTVTEMKKTNHFVALDLPDMSRAACVQVKGFYSDQPEEIIVANYKGLSSEMDKSSIIEMYFPWHSINKIRSLVFKAK